MPTTANWSIEYADISTPASIADIDAAQASSIENALNEALGDDRAVHFYRWADSSARAAQTGMTAGDFGYQTDTAEFYTYTGATWMAARVNAGLVPVIPTSSSSSVSSAGVVTFSAASSVSVNGCFTSAFTHYKVIVEVASRSASSFTTLKLRASGTDLSTGYDLVRTVATGSVAATQLANNGDIPLGSGNFPKQDYTIEVRQPQQARQSGVSARVGEINTAAAPTLTTIDGSTRSTSAYDGFTISAASGTMTGTLRIYGYN